jgi:hypothetical protein
MLSTNAFSFICNFSNENIYLFSVITEPGYRFGSKNEVKLVLLIPQRSFTYHYLFIGGLLNSH